VSDSKGLGDFTFSKKNKKNSLWISKNLDVIPFAQFRSCFKAFFLILKVLITLICLFKQDIYEKREK